MSASENTRISHLQRAVLDFVGSGSGHGIVEATAGSGKTTTLVQVAALLESELLAPGQGACFLAFNRSTARELRARLPAAVDATTIHALGRRMLLTSLGGTRLTLDDAKYHDLALGSLADTRDAALTALDPPEAASYLSRLSGLARLELTDPTDASAVAELAGRYRLRSPAADSTEALNALVAELLERGAASGRTGSVDFTDMVYLPLRYDLPPPQYAFVCVDEAQDLSRLNLEFVMRLLTAGARGLFVGDPYQAIYAFAGADARSLTRIAERTGATRLPLSVSYRCPVRHVTLARRFSPDTRPRRGAPTGTVTVLPAAALARSVQPGDLVMSRTNAPLISLAIEFASRGTACLVLGDDLASETIELARSLFPHGRLDEWRTVVDAAAATDARALEFRLLTDDSLARELDRSADRFQALRLALDALDRRWRPRPQATASTTEERGALPAWLGRWLPTLTRPTVDDLARVLAELLGGATGAVDGDADADPPSSSRSPVSHTARAPEPVVLATIHKAKGREAERVFLFNADQLGLTQGNADEDLSERNVLFVALTRAKRELVLVESSPGAVAARLAAGTGSSASRVPADAAPPDERWRPPERPDTARAVDRSDLHRHWDDILRLAMIMARSPAAGVTAPRARVGRLIIRYAATRRVQDPRRQAGSGGRGGGRR